MADARDRHKRQADYDDTFNGAVMIPAEMSDSLDPLQTLGVPYILACEPRQGLRHRCDRQMNRTQPVTSSVPSDFVSNVAL